MKLATHSGDFHADECTAISILRNIMDISEIIRTRDYDVINKCDIVVDVGTEYDPNKMRFDHHQPSFNERFDDHSATIMSSAGQVYKHYGKQYLKKVLPELEEQHLDFMYGFIYHRYIEALDANDNGVDAADNFQFESYTTALPARVSRLNASNDFDGAITICDKELQEFIQYAYKSTISGIAEMRQAFQDRFNFHKSGKVLFCTKYSYPLLEVLENELKTEILYIYTEKEREMGLECRIIALSKKYSFKTKKPLPEAWRGLRNADLDRATGVKDGVFVHRTGFLGIWKTRKAALQIIEILLQSAQVEQ